MTEFFKTASGAYNYVLIVSLIAWVVSGFGVLAGLHKHRTDTLNAVRARDRAERAQKQEEDQRKLAENRLAAAEMEIAQLKPKPFRERLLATLNQIDPKIESTLRAGTSVEFAGLVKQSQRELLDNLFAETESTNYITRIPHGESHGMGDSGPTSYVQFLVTPKLVAGR